MKKTNVKKISDKSAANRFLFVPYLQQSREQVKYKFTKNESQKWIPLTCSLLFRPEFVALTPHTRYIYVAILLLCGTLGTDEISANTRYLANALSVDERTINKALEELLFSNLLTERREENRKEEKKKEHNTTEQTQSETPDAQSNVVVCDFSKSFQAEDKAEDKAVVQNRFEPGLESLSKKNSNGNSNLSKFTIEECLQYVNICKAKGDEIKNVPGLATTLLKTGKSDVFIFATLYPEDQKKLEAEKYGVPIRFTNEPCSICFGAKLAEVNGKGNGYAKCEHCRNEKGKSTGHEPEGENK